MINPTHPDALVRLQATATVASSTVLYILIAAAGAKQYSRPCSATVLPHRRHCARTPATNSVLENKKQCIYSLENKKLLPLVSVLGHHGLDSIPDLSKYQLVADGVLAVTTAYAMA